jgi:hypothetical protein
MLANSIRKCRANAGPPTQVACSLITSKSISDQARTSVQPSPSAYVNRAQIPTSGTAPYFRVGSLRFATLPASHLALVV